MKPILTMFLSLTLVLQVGLATCAGESTSDRLVFPAKRPNGKRVVLISGDEEYRSEESMPMLGKILSQRHGFHCTVLFSFGPDGDYIDANYQAGLRGVDALDSADLMIIATRFRQPDAGQAVHITKFLNAGKPVIGLRTATHAFRGDGMFGRIKFDDFGREVLGEEWVGHHGQHQVQGTRSVSEPNQEAHPILRAVSPFFAPSDVYRVTHLTSEDTILLRGAVTESLDPNSAVASGAKNDPMQPLAWLHSYTSPDGKSAGASFCTTSGASVDLLDANLRRLVVNAAYYLTGQSVPRAADVSFVDPFYPSFYGFIRDDSYWKKASRRTQDFDLGQSHSMSDPPGSPAWPHRPTAAIQFQDGQRMAFVGNSLAERMNLFGYFESALHRRCAKQKLVVRNFGWPADEVALQQRPYNYTDIDDPLEVFSPDAFVCFFGLNESFAFADCHDETSESLVRKKLIGDYRAYLKRLRERFSRDGKPPHFVLVSPIAYESSDDSLGPVSAKMDRQLAACTEAIRQVAQLDGLRFVDVFEPTRKAFAKAGSRRYTVNGIHLNEKGDRLLAGLLESALFNDSFEPHVPTDQLRHAVVDKSWYHLQDYRMLNGWYVYGGRRTWDTGTFPTEIAKIRKMVAVRDQYVWDIATGKPVGDVPDDSRTGDVVVPDTMFGTRPDAFRKDREPQTLEYPTPKESIARMTMPRGFEVRLFASEAEFPQLANPAQLSFDNRGRLWVACMANYPQWSPTENKPNDRLLILEDTDDNGEADKATVFYDKLICPTGFEFWNGGVLVVDQPRVLFLKDTVGDDRADVVLHLMDGWGTDDTHHTCGAWEYSHDGRLYALEGVHVSTTLETPWGPLRVQGPSGGYVIDPKTWRVRHFRTPGYGNPWCMVFDDWGNGIVGDGTGSNQHWSSPLTGAAVRSRRTMRTIFDNEGMRPCIGSEFLATRHFPKSVRSHFVYGCVINMHGLTRFDIRNEANGAGFEGERIEDLLASTDNFFRPVDPKVGPDGALWFGDWCNPLIGHMQYSQRDPNRDHDHGRIYRLVYPNNPLLETVTHDDKSVDGLLAQLLSQEPRTRYRARRELRDRPRQKVLDAISAWVSDQSEPRNLCEALWVQAGHHAVDEALLVRILSTDDFQARAAAVRTIAAEHERIANAMRYLELAVDDEHPRVRLEAVRGLSFLDPQTALPLALKVTQRPVDYWIDYTLEHTMSAFLDAFPSETIEALTDSLNPDAREKFMGYRERLLPGGDVAKPLRLLGKVDSPAAEREQAVRALVGSSGGDAGRGQKVFARVCSSCHQVKGNGKPFGPDLSNVARRLSKEQLIRSIVNPNESIAKGFETVLVTTEAGKTHSGVVVEQTPTDLTMRVAEGKLLKIPLAQIEGRDDKRASSMPSGLIATIAPIEYLDLMNYLEARVDMPPNELRDAWLPAADDNEPLRIENDFEELSRDAQLLLEANFPARYNRNADLLFSPQSFGKQDFADFVIHSPDKPTHQPFIVVRLKAVAELGHIWIQNRMNSDYQDRATSLAAWISEGGTSWKKIWSAERIAPDWQIRLRPKSKARYIKIGLTGNGYLHLNRVAIFGRR